LNTKTRLLRRAHPPSGLQGHDRVREYLEPNFGRMETDRLLLSLYAAEDSARDAIVFVVPPVYLPTEAHALRQNPKTLKLVRLRDIEKS
jgi:hypothetical protein